MNDTQINNRQNNILIFLYNNPQSSRVEIETSLEGDKGSRITIIRDLNHLIKLEWVKQSGGGKYVKYSLKKEKGLLIPVDLGQYFTKKLDTRNIRYPKFNVKLVNRLSGLFSSKELKLFEQGKIKLKEKFEKTDPSLLRRELERFIIELSWKSSQIEGNTYSLLETEELIKNKKEAKGHDKNEAIRGLIENFLEPSGKDFVDELVYRFLLTKSSHPAISLFNLRPCPIRMIRIMLQYIFT